VLYVHFFFSLFFFCYPKVLGKRKSVNEGPEETKDRQVTETNFALMSLYRLLKTGLGVAGRTPF